MGGTQMYNVTLEDNRITTTVKSFGKAVEVWLDKVLYVHHQRLHKLVVGLNIEWRPSYSADQNIVAVLQLYIGHHCLIFKVIHTDYFPDELEDCLNGFDYFFIDVGVVGDTDRLWKDWKLKMAKMVDQAKLVEEETDRPSLRCAGLKDIAIAVMGADMEKPYRVRMSHWDAYNISGKQINYACIDAFISCEFGCKLLSGDY